jgi:hypothetical protein
MPSLQILAGPNVGTLIPLVGERIVVGRGPSGDIVIPISSVSRNHAQLTRAGETYFIEDTQSRNGTFVNNQRIITRTGLRSRDHIRICDFVAVYFDEPFGGVPEPVEFTEPVEGTVALMLNPPPLLSEQDWLASVNPIPLLDFLSARAATERAELFRTDVTSSVIPLYPSDSDPAVNRRLRLFVCACARRIWGQLGHPANQEGVVVAEQYADGKATAEDLDSAREAMRCGSLRESMVGYHACRENSNVDYYAARVAARAVEAVLACGQLQRCDTEGAALAALLRDVFRPFGQVTIDPAWLEWEGGLVGRLARAAYEERFLPDGTLDSTRLAVLADALEDAGCTCADLFEHLRGPGPHVRGCWAVDLLMGKP